MARGQRSKPGDTRWSPNGYHYTRTEDKWELTHRLTAEKKLGRPLADNERIRFADNDRANYADPDNIIVYVVKEKSYATKRAALEAKIADLQAKLEGMEELDA